VQLFVDRARATRPDFQVTPRNAAAVARLCERLEGIPLALELAAARAQMLTPSQMLMQLEARFDFLVSRRRDIAPRHRTLRAALDWSYELLRPELRSLFTCLSVFQGRFTLEAAEAVCGDGALGVERRALEEPSLTPDAQRPTPVLEYLTELRERSLILVTGDDEEEMGYRMLETLREYATAQLKPEERYRLRRRHAEYFLALAERAQPLLHGPEQRVWLDRLEADHDNFRGALSWCLSEPDARELGLELAGTFHFFWYVRGHFNEGRQWLTQFLAATDAAKPTAARAAALYAAARLAGAQGDLSAAGPLFEASLPIWRALGDWHAVARTLCQWGNVAEWMGDWATAGPLYQQSLAICRELNDRGLLGHVLKCLGVEALAHGNPEQARLHFEESLALYRELQNPRGTSMVLGEMANLALSQAEDDRAEGLLHEHLELARQLKDSMHMAMALKNLGHVARHRSDLAQARAHFEQSLALRRELGGKPEATELLAYLCAIHAAQREPEAARAARDECLALLQELNDRRIAATCLDLLAEVAVLQGSGPVSAANIERAARLLAASEAFRGPDDVALWWPAEREARKQCIEAVRAALGNEAFEAAWAEGREMSLAQAVSEARRLEL
jgi:hypothetical protein